MIKIFLLSILVVVSVPFYFSSKKNEPTERMKKQVEYKSNVSENVRLCNLLKLECNENQLNKISVLLSDAENGDLNSQYILGGIYYENKDYDKAFPLINKAEKHNLDGMSYTLGLMYQNGWGVEKNSANAFEYYKKSADKGIGNGKYNLALMYFNGEGVKQNYSSAYKYLSDLNTNHSNDPMFTYLSRAKYTLGVMYQNGWGVNINNNKAFKFYLDSSKLGYGLAQYNLGSMYSKGIGVKKDLIEAYAWIYTAYKNEVYIAHDILEKYNKYLPNYQLKKAKDLGLTYSKKYTEIK